MKLAVIIISLLLLGFNFNQIVQSWESNSEKKDAQKINIRNAIIYNQPICMDQLNKGYFPFNCYKLVNDINKLLPQHPINEEVDLLNELCRDYISRVNSKYEISNLAKILNTFKKCNKALLLRKKILDYKNIYK